MTHVHLCTDNDDDEAVLQQAAAAAKAVKEAVAAGKPLALVLKFSPDIGVSALLTALGNALIQPGVTSICIRSLNPEEGHARP